MFRKIINYLLVLFLFLLPWQTRWIYESRFLNKNFWEYGSSSLYATEILLWVIIILFAIDRFRNKEFWKQILSKEHYRKNKKLLHCYIITLLFFGISIFLSLSSVISFNFVFHIIEAACLFVILVNCHPEQSEGSSKYSEDSSVAALPQNDILKRILVLWFGGVVQGLFAIIQFFSQEVYANKWFGLASHNGKELGQFVIEFGDQRWLRAYGSFGSPNILGGFLAVMFVVGLILYLNFRCRGVLAPPPYQGGVRGGLPSFCKRDWSSVGFTVGQLIILSGLILSFSRGAWIAALVGVVLLVTCVIASEVKRSVAIPSRASDLVSSERQGITTSSSPRRVHLVMTLKQLFFSLLFITFFFIALKPLFLTRVQSQGRLEHKSITERVTQYQEFSQIFYQHPILGVGPGTYTLALYKSNPNLPVWRYQPIHNIYLLILAELGLAGGFLVFLFSCFFVRMIWRQNKLFIPVLISIFVLGLFDHWLWSGYFGVVFLGVVLGFSVKLTLD